MSADILLYAIVAAGLVVWLRNVLGTRHGDERERSNPFTAHENSTQTVVEPGNPPTPLTEGTVGNLHDVLDRNMSIETPQAEHGLMEISRADRQFDLASFLSGAQDAFVIVVEAFANHDREVLGSLLHEPVYKAFDQVMRDREEAKQEASVEIHAVRRTEVVDAYVKDQIAYITVKFVADETNVLRDENGEYIYGNPDYITETIDIWTFGRHIKSRDPSWMIYETRDEDAADQDHKTVPDA